MYFSSFFLSRLSVWEVARGCSVLGTYAVSYTVGFIPGFSSFGCCYGNFTCLVQLMVYLFAVVEVAYFNSLRNIIDLTML